MERGDRVTVVMTSNHIFPWQTAPSFEAIYESGPSGPGDCWTFIVDLDGDQNILHLNGNSREFAGVFSEAYDG